MTFSLYDSSLIWISLRSKELVCVIKIPNKKASAEWIRFLHSSLSKVDNFFNLFLYLFIYYTRHASLFLSQLFGQSACYVYPSCCNKVLVSYWRKKLFWLAFNSQMYEVWTNFLVVRCFVNSDFSNFEKCYYLPNIFLLAFMNVSDCFVESRPDVVQLLFRCDKLAQMFLKTSAFWYFPLFSSAGWQVSVRVKSCFCVSW